MGANLVSLNVNPCKMCMPMGAVSAFAGIKNCMSILHRLPGVRHLHQAAHGHPSNEPVDIASSSLTEQGTVFGGRENLIQGLENLIKLYNPEIIGVATTCLAETIGEDVPAILREFYDTHPKETVKIVNVASAGYGGTQYEGFNRALWSLVSQVEMDAAPNDCINIVTPMLSPADCRLLKSLLDRYGAELCAPAGPVGEPGRRACGRLRAAQGRRHVP
jgi:nitrogenase molybdenum-iron protein alpha/beta subunit